MISHRLILYSVSPCERIFKNVNFRCLEGKHDKEQGNHTKRTESQFRGPARHFVGIKACFADIRDRGGKEENGDVKPIGGFTDHAVVGIEDHGNQHKTEGIEVKQMNEMRTGHSNLMTKERWQKVGLFRQQKKLLDTFLQNGAISQAQYNKSFGDLRDLMGMHGVE